MKRIHRAHHRYGSRRKSSVFSAFLLILSWIAVLPVAALAFLSVWNDVQPRAEATEPTDQPVFAQLEPHALDVSYEHVRSLKTLRGAEPTILIYHTHTTEAYLKTPQSDYRETSSWRTDDADKNVIAVGEALKEILERQYGFHVIHDTTNHEPPKLATSYDRSLVTMQKYHKKYPSIVLFIDLHRDAYQAVEKPTDYVIVNGTETAKLMFVVGRGDKYQEKPFYETNVTLAKHMTEYLQSIDSKLARPVRIKAGRYNQHVSPNCILVEVGHNANTLEQSIAAMPYLADSIAYAFPYSADPSMWSPN